MTDQSFQCRECGGPTKLVIDAVAPKPELVEGILRRQLPSGVMCAKCYESEKARRLAIQNLERKAELDRQWERMCPPLYRLTDPNHPAIDQDLLAKVLGWDPAAAGGKGILLHGPTGTCKTRMMFLLVHNLHYQDVKILWTSAIKLSSASAEKFDDDEKVRNKARKLLKNALRAEVLFIDDLGKERFTDTTERDLFQLIETRTSQLRPTLWTSNASSRAALRKLMSENRGQPIMRRLAEFSTVYFVPPLYERAQPIKQVATSARSASSHA
jgi:DNA replication protein DnaC